MGPAEHLGSSPSAPSRSLLSSGPSPSHFRSSGLMLSSATGTLRPHVRLAGAEYLDAVKDAYQFTEVKQVEPVERDVCFAPRGFYWECFNWYAVGTDRLSTPQYVHRTLKGGQGGGSHLIWSGSFRSALLSQVARQTLKGREVQTRKLLVQNVPKTVSYSPCFSRTTSVVGVTGTLLDSWVRGPPLPGTDTSFSRCCSCW